MDRRYLVAVLGLIACAAVAVTYAGWDRWFGPAPPAAAEDGHPDEHPERVKLSPQARKNLGLRVAPIALAKEPVWRTLAVPGAVVDRPGNTDRLVAAPAAGVLTHIGVLPGEQVRPGKLLFSLKPTGESFQTAQASLYKTQQEVEFVRAEQKRLQELAREGGLSAARLIELENQKMRLLATLETLGYELRTHGLDAAEVKGIAKGQFVTEIRLRAPAPEADGVPSPSAGPVYEVEDLKAVLGEKVEKGQALCRLADHSLLLVEGKAFQAEVPLVQRAAHEGLPVRAEFLRGPGRDGAQPEEGLTITTVASRMDPRSNTLSFYLPLPNREVYPKGDKRYRMWRFRPGERVVLHVPVESFAQGFVLPAEGVVREGPEAYVFVQNGDWFERRAVHVLFEDSGRAVLGPDSNLVPGHNVAHNGAAALNRALKAAHAGDAGHGHSHPH